MKTLSTLILVAIALSFPAHSQADGTRAYASCYNRNAAQPLFIAFQRTLGHDGKAQYSIQFNGKTSDEYNIYEEFAGSRELAAITQEIENVGIEIRRVSKIVYAVHKIYPEKSPAFVAIRGQTDGDLGIVMLESRIGSVLCKPTPLNR